MTPGLLAVYEKDVISEVSEDPYRSEQYTGVKDADGPPVWEAQWKTRCLSNRVDPTAVLTQLRLAGHVLGGVMLGDLSPSAPGTTHPHPQRHV